MFSCFSRSALTNDVVWLINETTQPPLDGVTYSVINVQFINVSVEYNNTKIQCILNGEMSSSSMLLIQGLLSD